MSASKAFLTVSCVIAIIVVVRPAVAEESPAPVYLQPDCAHTHRREATAPRAGRYPARCQGAEDGDPFPAGDVGDRNVSRRPNDIGDHSASNRSRVIDWPHVPLPRKRGTGADHLFRPLPLNSPNKAP